MNALLLALALVLMWGEAQAQPLPRVRVQGSGAQVADVDHAGALLVHVTNAAHITVSVGAISSTSDAVNVFHQSTIAHVSSVTHVVGTMALSNQAGTLVTVTGTALDVNCTGCSASANVNVDHISSATHVVGRVFLTNALGAAVTVTGTALDVNCTGCAAASVVNVGHIASALHVVVTDLPRSAHLAAAQSGAWTVAAHQAGIWTIAHISSALHIAGVVSVSCANCSGGSGDAVNVFHQSTVRHVSSLTHVVIVDWQRWAHVASAQSGAWSVVAHQGGSWTVAATQSGAWNVSAAQSGVFTVQAAHQGGQWNIAHIGSAVHIAGVVSVTCANCSGGSGDAVNVFHQSTVRHISSLTHVVIVDWQRWAHVAAAQSGAWSVVAHQGGSWTVAATQSGAWNVSAAQSGGWVVTATHQAGEWNVRHIGGALHIAGTINGAAFHIQGLGLPGQAHGGVLSVQGVAGGVALSVSCANCSGGSGDAVNVFHQSTVRHISSVTHVAGYGTFLVNLHGAATSSVSQSGTWNVVAHQGGTWNIGHISAKVHVGGHVALVSQFGTYVTVTGTALDVNCTGCSAAAAVNVGHISSVVHVAGYGSFLVNFHGAASASVAQSGVWNVVAHQGGGGWNIAHISSRVHIQGHVFLTTYNGVPLRTYHGNSLSMTMQNADGQEIEWTTATSHVSSQVHLAVAQKPGSGHLLVEVRGPHLTGAIHVSGLSNIGSGDTGTGTTSMVCHSYIALHLTGTGFAAAGGTAVGGLRSQAILHLTSANGGINQATWRFYICGIGIWTNFGIEGTGTAALHKAASISLVEGSGTDCGTSPIPIMGSLGTNGIPLAPYHQGATINISNPFPFIGTRVPGNSLCIYHSMKGAQYITGFISYRASP